MAELHFHQSSLCMNCGHRRVYSSPIPHIMILSEVCEGCGWLDCVGSKYFQVCSLCAGLWVESVRNESVEDIFRAGH